MADVWDGCVKNGAGEACPSLLGLLPSGTGRIDTRRRQKKSQKVKKKGGGENCNIIFCVRKESASM